MKIYKSNLQGLIEELKGPVYITATQQNSQAKIGAQDTIPCAVFGVSAAGFNAEGRVIELQLRQPSVIALFDEEVRQAAAANSRVLADLKARLTELGFEVRDGAISAEPVIGSLE
jgi:hypothetical protein